MEPEIDIVKTTWSKPILEHYNWFQFHHGSMMYIVHLDTPASFFLDLKADQFRFFPEIWHIEVHSPASKRDKPKAEISCLLSGLVISMVGIRDFRPIPEDMPLVQAVLSAREAARQEASPIIQPEPGLLRRLTESRD